MLLDNLIRKAMTILLIVVAAFALLQTSRLAASQRRTTATALAADTLQASADTTRALHIEVAGLGESLRVSQRRAVQVAQRADALDRSLGLERVARDQLRSTITRLQADVRSDTVFVETADGERRAAFDVRSAPYTVHADVALPPPPSAGRMDVRVELDTLALEMRVGCGIANVNGVRPALVTAVAPKWATVRLDRVEQAPGVCAADVQQPGRARWWALESIVARFGVSVGYVAARTPSGAVVAGPGVAAAFKVWP